MELVLKLIIAPLLIAGVVAIFRLRGMVWLVGPAIVSAKKEKEKRIFQRLMVWNGGGHAEENIVIRIPERLGARLLGSSDGLATQQQDVISIASLPSGDKCEMLLSLTDEITKATSISIKSKAVKSANFARSESEVSTANGLGWFAIFILVVASVVGYFAIDNFFGENSDSNKSEEIARWPEWNSVGDFAKSDIAKFYPSPSFPVVTGKWSRKGDVATVPVVLNNVTDQVINFRVSLSSSDSEGDPRPWDRRNLINDLVIGPGTQKKVDMNVFIPRKIESGFVVVDVTIKYGEHIHFAQKNVEIR